MGLFDFLQTKKAPVSRTPLICHKMAHYALPYALFRQVTPTAHAWIDGTIGYQLFRYVAEIEIGDPATREGSCAAIEAFRCFPTETEMMSATAVYLSLKYPETAQVGPDAIAARGMSATPLLLGPLYSIATVVNSSVEQTRYYIVEKTTAGQTRLLQVDKFGREFDLGLGPAPIPSLIQTMILEMQRAQANTAKTETKSAAQVIKDERYYGSILELSGKLSKAEITKRYKELIAKYHPDKVQHLGTEFQLMAEQKAKQINEAYEFFRNKYFLH